MADENDLARTEEPTPRRREEARKRGQIAFSTELTAALVVLVAALFLGEMAPALGGRLVDAFRMDLKRIPHQELDIGQAQALATRMFERFALMLGSIFAVLVLAGIGACVAQVGVRFVPDRLSPDFERISPAAGWQRLWSLQSAWRVLLSILKVALLVTVAVIVFRARAGVVASLGLGSLSEAIGSGWSICLRMFTFLALVLVILGAIDYLVQWRKLESALRMTRQELKEEIKREEGDPMVRNRIRQLQRRAPGSACW